MKLTLWQLSGHTAVPVATSSWSTQAFSDRSRARSWLEVISQLGCAGWGGIFEVALLPNHRPTGPLSADF